LQDFKLIFEEAISDCFARARGLNIRGYSRKGDKIRNSKKENFDEFLRQGDERGDNVLKISVL
jgi:hypothetical protein